MEGSLERIASETVRKANILSSFYFPQCLPEIVNFLDSALANDMQVFLQSLKKHSIFGKKTRLRGTVFLVLICHQNLFRGLYNVVVVVVVVSDVSVVVVVLAERKLDKIM